MNDSDYAHLADRKDCAMTGLGNIRAIAFDVFGTLLRIHDPRDHWRQLLIAARRQHGLAMLDPRREPIENMDAFAAANCVRFQPRWQVALDAEIASIRMAPGAYEILADLRGAGYRVALASNLSPAYIPTVDRLLGDLVDIRCYSCAADVRAIKPEPAFFHALTERLGVAAADILMVGDSLASDIAGAAAAGMPALHLQSLIDDPGQNQIRNLFEVPMALGLVDNASRRSTRHSLSVDEHRARAQAQALAAMDMMDAVEAGRMLGLSSKNPFSDLRILEEQRALIRVQRGGSAWYPRAQFDRRRDRIFPVIQQLLKMQPSHMSHLRLACWLNCAHVDFGRAPAEMLGHDDDAVIAAFARAIEPETHG